MQIFEDKNKKELLDSLEGLRRAIPLMDMDDRDFTAAVLHRMAKIVQEHGPSHGVNLDPKFIIASDGMKIGDYTFKQTDEGDLSIAKDPEDRPWFLTAGRRSGKTAYQAELLAMIREVEDRKKSVRAFKLDEGDIAKVIYAPPATIIYWKDGTKTVVKCSDHDLDEGRLSPETGLVYAIAKKVLGNKGNYNDVLRRLVKRAKKEE